ncbi:MAG TPA: CpsD/CapB family tyrosine-protein kinase [Pyrinomonadaceae bacterium]|jgi:capsular exopolysaccharide synthesis family protein
MGRVYEALKRAADKNGTPKKRTDATAATTTATAPLVEDDLRPTTGAIVGAARNGDGQTTASGVHNAVPEYLLHTSQYFTAPETARVSASNERTEQHAGSALPGVEASRVAGATLGAAGSTRTPEFVSIDIPASRVEPHLVAITQPRSPHAERFRSLRTRVLHAGERRKMQAFVITSAGIMEGKTLTSINLSWLLAQTDGVRGLLIDGDLRQPCVAEYLGIDMPVGLSEVLAGEATLAETIVRLEPAGLHLLPGGSARDNVAELLSGPRFLAVLSEVRRMFDYIIIDAPPLGIFTDASVLINRADAALIVARSGKTRYSALDRLLEPLPRERLLGVVLNGSEEQMDEHGYYYQRRYVRRPVATTEAQRIAQEEMDS